MKKVTFQVPVMNRTKKVEVSGYETTLKTGHTVVVHRSLNNIGWAVTFKESGILFVNMERTRGEALQEANFQAKKLGSTTIDKKLAQLTA